MDYEQVCFRPRGRAAEFRRSGGRSWSQLFSCEQPFVRNMRPLMFWMAVTPLSSLFRFGDGSHRPQVSVACAVSKVLLGYALVRHFPYRKFTLAIVVADPR